MTEWFELRVSIKVPLQHLLSHRLITKCMEIHNADKGRNEMGRNDVTLLLLMGNTSLAGKFILTLMCV